MASISCKVNDSRTGLPAVNMRVILRAMSHIEQLFEAKTDVDGNVTRWQGTKNKDYELSQFLEEISEHPDSVWQLGVDVENYFGSTYTSFKWFDINFVIKHCRPYHFVMMVGPFGNQYRLTAEALPWKAPEIPAQIAAVAPMDTGLNDQPGPRGFSTHQTKQLMECYIDEPYPNPTLYDTIARTTDLNRKKVRTSRRRKAADRKHQMV